MSLNKESFIREFPPIWQPTKLADDCWSQFETNVPDWEKSLKEGQNPNEALRFLVACYSERLNAAQEKFVRVSLAIEHRGGLLSKPDRKRWEVQRDAFNDQEKSYVEARLALLSDSQRLALFKQGMLVNPYDVDYFQLYYHGFVSKQNLVSQFRFRVSESISTGIPYCDHVGEGGKGDPQRSKLREHADAGYHLEPISNDAERATGLFIKHD